jgi:hypothetical protein
MKLATAPVNWNSPDVPEYRAYTHNYETLYGGMKTGKKPETE